MKINRGHARCNAAGLRYIKKENFDYLIVMDGDGEDRPIEIKDFINKIIENQKNTSIVAKELKDQKDQFFKILYMVHKFITFIFYRKKLILEILAA